MHRFVELAHRQRVELICFPECCVSGYWHLRNLTRTQLEDLSESASNGLTAERLRSWSSEYNMTIGAGFVERAGTSLYNSYLVSMPDGSTVCHRKLHCFISEHMESGDEHTVFTLPTGQKVSVLVCYDNNLIENVRICALRGAEIVMAPHQTGGCDSGSPYAMGVVPRHIWDQRETNPRAVEAELRGEKGRGWLMRWLPARAHDNGLYYIFSNGIGPDDDEVRTGNAMVLDCYGRIVAETWKAGDDMVVADLDGSLRERSTGARWLRARRPSLYGTLTEASTVAEDTRAVRFDHKK